jgi:hypothetical protein
MNSLRVLLMTIAIPCTFSPFAYGSVENLPKDVQTVAETFKLGNFVRSIPGGAPSGSTSATRLYYFEKGAVDTIDGEVFDQHGLGRGVAFTPDVGVDDIFSAQSLAPYVLTVGIQQKLGRYINASTYPDAAGRITLHFENGDVWQDYRGRERTADDELVGMLLKNTVVPGRILRDAAAENLGSFIRMENGIFYFERGRI